ncbi:MAG: hypothetical protein HYZ60_01025, partial [Methylocystis sp.]|nr:hypothetical protein [Methylocystis sp.]
MAVDEKILGVVWAETASLAAADGLATGKARLQAVVAYLFNRARSRGMEAAFLAPAPLPATTVENGDRRVEAMRQTVETALATGQYNGVDLPRRAVLWEVNTTGEPKQSEQPAPTWVKSGATRISDYRLEYDSTGRRFRLFESDDDPGADDAVFVSSLTKAASQRVVEPPRATKTRSNVWPWLVGLGAAAMFFWMALTLAYVGRVTSQAYKLLSGVETEYSGAIADETFAACTTVGKAAAARASTPAGAPIARVWVDACSGPNSPVDKTLDGVLEAIKSCGE